LSDIALAGWDSPYVWAYPWVPGFGVKYANPATLPTGNAYTAAFYQTATVTDLAIAHDTSPAVSVYPWTLGVGFGVK
jgi:hypothetical protein